MKNIACYALLWLIVSGCGPTILYDYAKEKDPREKTYLIDQADHLRVAVWRMPELSADVIVRPDGAITLPLLGDVHAAGLTTAALQERVAQLLPRYIKDGSADVTVTVLEPNGYRYAVIGNVERGGVFVSRYHVTVAEAVALAGGLNRYAAPRRMLILRNDGSKKFRRIPIDFTRARSGEHPEENLILAPGDFVVVR